MFRQKLQSSSVNIQALEVEFIISRQKCYVIMINGDNKINMKHDNVRIIRIILDLHGLIVDSEKVVLFEYVKPLKVPFYNSR